MHFADIEEALKVKSGTVVINSADGFIPKMAGVSLAALNAFKLPVALNMYITNPGQQVSAPPHTDKQDVFVMQCQGMKHWRVFAPPPPSRMPKVDPFARGKGSDLLDLHELDLPLIECVLQPGQVLYIPAGYPHTTDTRLCGAGDGTDPSLHMTLGVDTHIWALNYAGLRSLAIRHAGLTDKLNLLKLDPSLYWKLQVCKSYKLEVLN